MTTFDRLWWPAGLYFLLALGLLAPMASDSVLPEALDHANHTASIIQAKMALDEGQFPLKVAPFQHDGLRYPLFQFYSNTPYLIGGLIYKYLTPSNPWLALKIVYFLGLCISGLFVFKTGELLGFERSVSVLMGVAYITAPYLLINILTRGAYTEAFAQFILPILGYASLRLVMRPTRFGYVWPTLAWLFLGTSHVITFVYGTGFYLFLVLILYLFRRIDARSSITLLIACGLGWCISAFQWYPAATIGPLQIHGMLGDVYSVGWLTPISTLFAPVSVAPEPLGRDTPPFLNPALGMPTLIALAGLVYFKRRLGDDSRNVWPLMLVFGLAFFCAWSPVNFWSIVPDKLKIVQFPYRFLTYTVAVGTVLFGYFANIYGRHYGSPSFLGWLLCLILFANSYLPTLQHNTRSLDSIVKAPDLGYGSAAYLYAGEVPASIETYRGKYETGLSLISGDDWLLAGDEMPLARAYIENSDAALVLSGDASTLAGPCRKLDLVLDGRVIASRDIAPGPFQWRVPNAAFRRSKNPVGQLSFQSECGFVPAAVDPGSHDTRHLWIRVSTLKFLRSAGDTMTVEDMRRQCKVKGSKVDCTVNRQSPSEAQLPVLYYPSLLQIRLNGKSVPYRPSAQGALALAMVSLPAGQNHIVASFAGSSVGNLLSLFGIVALLIVTYLALPLRRQPQTDDQIQGN